MSYKESNVIILIIMQFNPVFIGVSCRVLNVRPAAFFFVKCNLHSKEIQELYSTAQDGYESTHLYTVSRVSSNFVSSRDIFHLRTLKIKCFFCLNEMKEIYC